jgi:hypothetical protein
MDGERGYPWHLPPALALHLEILRYPILARRIRERMRQELFARGIITPEAFEAEVREKALISQRLEGLTDPFGQESAEEWEERLAQIRDQLTEFYFAYNLPHSLFVEIVRSVLEERAPGHRPVLTFNPELAPVEALFAQAEAYEAAPPEQRKAVLPHLKEIRVVLIKSIISDQLAFVGIAREHFTSTDLRAIYERRIGQGKIGGKAAGMMLAWRVLQTPDPEDPFPLAERVGIPDSWFIGADVFYEFMERNGLLPYLNQKYKTEEEIRAEFPEVQHAFLEGRFPGWFVQRLRDLLREIGPHPLIVRSSSLLEDNFGASFAGKYESHFCPNQGSLEENLEALLTAIKRVYASVFHPDPLIYRRHVGLLDYDERMAILLQKVEGTRYGRYFFPPVAGVAYSRNPFRWSPRIRREDGFVRMVVGLGTRAVERVAHDYPRMVALSHPGLRPEKDPQAIARYAQHFIDVIDLEENTFRTLPVHEVLAGDYPGLAYLAVVHKGDYLQPLIGRNVDPRALVLTFDRLLQETDFAPLMRAVLRKLERYYGRPVDVEFAVLLGEGRPPRPMLRLLQCRPQTDREQAARPRIPRDVPAEDVLFTSYQMVPHGAVYNIRYVVYVDPMAYTRIPELSARLEIARVIGRLNRRLAGERFILIGPGRWGSVNPYLGVKVGYADIYNARALVEIGLRGAQGAPEPSYGTHFFRDLIEAQIYPLALIPDDERAAFRADFFLRAPNILAALLPEEASHAGVVKVIDIPAVASGRYLHLVMDGDQEEAMAYLGPKVEDPGA